MPNKLRPISTFLVGMLLVNAAVLYAAEQVPVASPEADPREDQTAEEMLAAEAALEAQQAQASGPTEDQESESSDTLESDAPEAAATDLPGRGEEDFVPTIQISEDLSVSFPVDI